MSDKLGVMVIGPGWVGEEHVMAHAKDPRTEVRVIAGTPGVEADAARAKEYMERYGVQAEYTEDYERALSRDDIQIVAVCTRNYQHYAQTLASLEAGKHVFIEKPLCFTLEEARTLGDLARKKALTTHVGYVVRYYPAMRGLWRMVHEQKMIGDIFYAEADYWHEMIGPWKVSPKTGGSALLMGGGHAVDCVRWMMGEDREVAEVFAWSVAPQWRMDFEYDPTICLMMKYRDGALAKVACSLECNMPYVFHLQVNGTEGTVRNNGITSEKVLSRHITKGWMPVPGDYPDDWNVAQHPFPTEVGYFLDCVESGDESELSISRSSKTTEVIVAAQESAKTGKPVSLPL